MRPKITNTPGGGWRRTVFAVGILVATGAASLVAQGVLEPAQVQSAQLADAPFASTGLLEMEVNRRWYRGSAAVARDPRLIFTWNSGSG